MPEEADGAAAPEAGSILKIKLARRLAASTFVNTVGATMASVAVGRLTRYDAHMHLSHLGRDSGAADGRTSGQ